MKTLIGAPGSQANPAEPNAIALGLAVTQFQPSAWQTDLTCTASGLIKKVLQLLAPASGLAGYRVGVRVSCAAGTNVSVVGVAGVYPMNWQGFGAVLSGLASLLGTFWPGRKPATAPERDTLPDASLAEQAMTKRGHPGH